MKEVRRKNGKRKGAEALYRRDIVTSRGWPGSATDSKLTYLREWKSLLAIAIPVVLSELGWMFMTIVDMVMVGRLGPASIGAVGVGNAVYYAPALFGIGILLGLDTLVSQAYGRGEFDECHRSLAQAVYLAIVYTPLCMLMVWAATYLFHSWGITPEVARLGGRYLRVLNFGTLPLLLYAAIRRYLQGVGRARMVTFALISANLLNWAGNWVLIYGRLGAPAMGVRGSALSTLFSRIYLAGLLLLTAWHHEAQRGHSLFGGWAAPDVTRLSHLLRLGTPAASQIVLEVGAFGAATVLAGRLAPEALAAHQIALNWASITYMVPLGVSAAAAVAVGHAVGAADGAKAQRAGWLGILTATSFMGIAAILFLVFPRELVKVYTANAGVLRLCVPLFGLAGAFQIFDGVQGVATGALRGLGETRMPMYANLIGYWLLGLPLGYLLCFGAGWGIYGLWIGLTLALILISIAILLQWSRLSRRLATTGIL
ncbi:MAG TPA: MATE family efflux transporter [Acidisarcina sp.]